MRAKFINEVFTNDSDPIQDLGIGGVNPTKKYDDIMQPVIREYFDYLLSLKGKKLKGKFRLEPDIEKKKYNVITGKITELKFLGKHFIKERDKMMIIFVDDENTQYYYYFADGEKFYTEE